jgi:hypothetical protein
VFGFLVLVAGCSLFSTRDPEPPETGSSTFLQPDTPDRVVENIRRAVTELNTNSYMRSFAESFEYEPSVSARARDPVIWNGWSRVEEETYFSRLKAAGELLSGHSLQLVDVQQTVLSEDRYVVDATYVLDVPHTRSDEDIPTQMQGRLIWEIAENAEGLWYLERWTDQELGENASWSELKAAFVK